MVFKPDDAQSYYLSYGTSYNPAIEYLISRRPIRVSRRKRTTRSSWERKLKILNGAVTLTGALFDTHVTNVRNSDPDDPTVQDAPFDQRVRGLELGVNGYLTDIWELAANYSHLDDRITPSMDRSFVGGKAGAQYAARRVEFMDHRGAQRRVDGGRRLHGDEPSLR